MAQRIVGLDIGAHSIKVVHLSGSLRGFTIEAYDEELVPTAVAEENSGAADAEMDDDQYAGVRQALAALRDRGALRGDLFVVGLPGNLATTRTVRLPFADSKRVEATLPFEVDAMVPFDLEDMVMTHQVLSGQIEGKTDVLVGLAKKQDVAVFLDLLHEAGVDPRHVELDALALDDLYRHLLAATDEAEQPTVTPGGTAIVRGGDMIGEAAAVVDIGASHTAICALVDDQVVAARTVQRGGADLTRALARVFALPLAEAEDGKLREAYLEVDGIEAPFPEQKRISDCLTAALQPIVREIRQSMQAVVAQRRVRVTRVWLCGGGARIPNLDRFLARALNVDVRRANQVGELLAPALPVERWQEGTDMGHAAKALAFALSGYSAHKSERLDFRRGELAYRGDFEFLEGRVTQMIAGVLVLALLLAFNGYASHFVLSRQEKKIALRQTEACETILGRSVQSAERCLRMMHEQIGSGGNGAVVPERTVIDAYLEVARRTPKDVTLKVEELEISMDKVRLKGVTDSYESANKVVESLKNGECFRNVQQGKARQVKAGVSFNVNLDVQCGTALAQTEEG